MAQTLDENLKQIIEARGAEKSVHGGMLGLGLGLFVALTALLGVVVFRILG
jgi:hypothetical protein